MATIKGIIRKHHVGHFNTNLSCPILPPDHSEETLTTSQIGSWQKC